MTEYERGWRDAMEAAAKLCEEWSVYEGEEGEWSFAMAEGLVLELAAAIRALLPDEHGPEQAGGDPASETDREPVGPGDVQRSQHEADKRGKQK